MGTPYVSLPDTDHSVFYAYSIMIGQKEIGSFEKFSERSTRTVERIREIMYSTGAKVIDMVWGGTDITLELNYVELYNQSLFQAFGVAWRGLEHVHLKFNISEVKYNPRSLGSPIAISFMNCVPSDYSKDIDTGTARVMNSMTVQAAYVV